MENRCFRLVKKDTSASARRKKDQYSCSSRKKQKTSTSYDFRDEATTIRAKVVLRLLSKWGR